MEVRLEPPQVSPVSTFHYVNHGGSEFVVYRVMPEGVASGVRVGDHEYPGFPAKGAGITSDPALRVAFFALLYDQDLKTPIQLFARDEAGNEGTVALEHQVFPKPYAKSRIELNDAFLQRVVPAIAGASPDEGIATDDILAGFLKINGDLRQKNNALVAGLAAKTSPDLKFKDAFQQLGDSQVEARFADTRTYVYKGKEVDRQVHLGYDLAVTAQVPIAAAHRGTVVHAGDLGIYGNCVVLDHGLGVQSLYGHLSSIDVKVGDSVEKGQTLGRSGMTGLAGGDHLHFTMLVGGQQVTPVDWWSKQWMEDRVLRKIAAAGGSAWRPGAWSPEPVASEPLGSIIEGWSPHMPSARHAAPALLVLFLTVSLVACGGGGESAPPAARRRRSPTRLIRPRPRPSRGASPSPARRRRLSRSRWRRIPAASTLAPSPRRWSPARTAGCRTSSST